jgi:hypothetical protein
LILGTVDDCWFGAGWGESVAHPHYRPICSRPLSIAAKGAPVATKVVHLSDLSGREAEDEGQLGRLVVLEHPDIGEPAALEVFRTR